MVVRLHPHTKCHGQGGVDETGEARSVGHGVDASFCFLGHVGVESYLWVCVVFIAHGGPLWSTWWKWSRVICGVGIIWVHALVNLGDYGKESKVDGQDPHVPETAYALGESWHRHLVQGHTHQKLVPRPDKCFHHRLVEYQL